MGLCIVQKIVSNHGGNILIDSKPGIDTTVNYSYRIIEWHRLTIINH